jgi:hypothetical protein
VVENCPKKHPRGSQKPPQNHQKSTPAAPLNPYFLRRRFWSPNSPPSVPNMSQNWSQKCQKARQFFGKKADGNQYAFRYHLLLKNTNFLLIFCYIFARPQFFKMSVSSRRNTDFSIFDHPKKDVEGVSPKNQKNRHLGPLFRAVWASKSSKKRSKNELEKTMQKK